jgi:acyl-CoA synthetase (AMP-forming)/AMP-acid ligase II
VITAGRAQASDASALPGEAGWLLTRAAEQWPDRDAVVLGDIRLTFHDLWRRSVAVAHDLVAGGLQPGDRVLWQLPNRIEDIVLHFAAWRIGAISVPVVPVYREHELRSIIIDSAPDAVAFCGTPEQAEAKVGIAEAEARRAGRPRPLVIDVDGYGLAGGCEIRWGCTDVGITDAGLPDPGGPDEPNLILFTSGTTSAPKGVVHSSRTVMAETCSWPEMIRFGEDLVTLIGAPISHIAGLLTAVLVPVLVGGCGVVMERWDPDAAVFLADREKVTMSAGATVFLRELLERYEDPAFTGHRIAWFLAGGTNVDPDLVLRADILGITVFRSWGMTESPSVTLASLDDPLALRANFDGRLSPGAEVQAVDENRLPMPAGEDGELRVRCREQMLGYLKPEQTCADVDDDGWFYSGDIGSINADGWVRITGRRKDIINRGGEKFSARDIEEMIALHPDIAVAAVIATTNPRLGEQVTAIVTLRRGHSWPGRARLADHLDSVGLARQKFPESWRIVAEIPMTPSGKAQKHLLLKHWRDTLHKAAEPE